MKNIIVPLRASKRVLVSLFLCFLVIACNAQDKSKTIQVGPNAKADLLIYFKSDATKEEIDEFLNKHILLPDPSGRGFRFPDGVQGYLRLHPPVQGHEGIALKFASNIPQEKKDQLKKSIETSPLIYRILEDISPSDVKSLNAIISIRPQINR